MFYVSVSLNNRTINYVSFLSYRILYNYEIYRSKEFSSPKMSLPLHLERSATPATCQWYKIFNFVHFASRKHKLDMSTTLNAFGHSWWSDRMLFTRSTAQTNLPNNCSCFIWTILPKCFFCHIQPAKIFARRDFYLGNGQHHKWSCKNLTINSKSQVCFYSCTTL